MISIFQIHLRLSYGSETVHTFLSILIQLVAPERRPLWTNHQFLENIDLRFLGNSEASASKFKEKSGRNISWNDTITFNNVTLFITRPSLDILE